MSDEDNRKIRELTEKYLKKVGAEGNSGMIRLAPKATREALANEGATNE